MPRRILRKTATRARVTAPAANSTKKTLGSVMRTLRARNGWTLKQMSARSGIPFSTLSKVEHDRLTLSYDKLQKMSDRLNIPLTDLFAEPGDTGGSPETGEAAVNARRSIGGLEQAMRVETKNYDYYYLCPELRRKRMVPLLTRVRAKSLAEFGELVRHPGEEFIYVLEGRVEVHTEFYDSVRLDPGQIIYIDSNMGHAYLVGAGCEEALIFGACSSSDADHMRTLLSAHGERARGLSRSARRPARRKAQRTR